MLLYLILISCIIMKGQCEEPKSCSQFYYVDQLLEKMIRMEIKVEGVDKEITKTNIDAQTTLEDIKRERGELKTEFQEMTKEIRTALDNMKETLLTPNVIFKARKIDNLKVTAGQTLLFNELMFNYGSGYDNSTGIFTATVSGVYLFTFHVCVNKGNNFYYGIIVDGIPHTSGNFYDQAATKCYTADGMLPLRTGQKVWIGCLSSSANFYHYTSSIFNSWNTFSGMLVHK